MRRAAVVAGAAGGLGALAPEPALAHGISQRADLPIPEWLFTWAAAVVLVVSFVALAVLWPRPKLETDAWRPLPGGVGRALASGPVRATCGAAGVLLLGLVLWSGLGGQQVANANFAPTFVYVVFWVGLVLASVVLGDVFRAFNPWLALGRLGGVVAGRLARGRLPDPLPYPQRLGHWPAVLGVLAFTWFELAFQDGDLPRYIAFAALVYSAFTLVGMALYGSRAWIDHAEAFSVYFGLFSRLSPFEARDGQIGLRPPLAGLARLEALPGTVGLLAVAIGGVTFDGASEGPLVGNAVTGLVSLLQPLGLSPRRSAELALTLGLLGAVALIYMLYRLAVAALPAGAKGERGRLGGAFVHSLVPIALAYVAAHYATLLVFQGQAIAYLVSDPLGSGADLFGTASRQIDYRVLGANAIWYLQVGFVVAGHVAALTLAHDRALVLYEHGRRAVRSQVPMLAVMVSFTTLALWLLSQANA